MRVDWAAAGMEPPEYDTREYWQLVDLMVTLSSFQACAECLDAPPLPLRLPDEH